MKLADKIKSNKYPIGATWIGKATSGRFVTIWLSEICNNGIEV
jgi:hypothetical protein